MDINELKELKVAELRTKAAELGISKLSSYKKDELIELILKKTAVVKEDVEELSENACGILEINSEGFGFLRNGNYSASDSDVYVSPILIHKLRLKNGDLISGHKREPKDNERYHAITRVMHVNGCTLPETFKRTPFEKLTPIFPDSQLKLERKGEALAMRVMDLLCPLGKGQRGLIVAPPKAGKTTILKDLAVSILDKEPEAHLIILLVDERPEEVTDIKELITGKNVEIVYSTFDEPPERHRRVSEVTIEHAKRMVECGRDVYILMDSITRLARAYNLSEQSTGRTLSGGLNPAALYMPKKFFGAARNTREAGSLTILATALIDTGSKMDDVIYEEFKGTGNMELVLSRKLQERRIFPAIDINKSGTRREDLLLTKNYLEAANIVRRSLNNRDDLVDRLLDMFIRTRSNDELVDFVLKNKGF